MKLGVPPVVAVRTDEVPAGVVIPPDVRVAFCAGCQARVLLAPSSRAAVRAGQMQPACMACASRLLGLDPSVFRSASFPPGADDDRRRWEGTPSFDHEEG